jgi:FkbM family methyltransferase
LIEIIVGVLLFLLIAGFHRELLLIGLVAVGRGPGCPLPLVFPTASVLAQNEENLGRIKAESRVIETDPASQAELWQTPRGRFWILAKSGEAFVYDLAEQLRGIYAYKGLGARAGDIVLDCGANVGVYTRIALDVGAAKVVAIEPAPENVRVLRKNFEREVAEGRVLVYSKGVWDKEDMLPMTIDPSNSAADSFVLPRGKGAKVQMLSVTTIDKIVAELGLERVDFIKFDIEGAERRALAGARATLARYRPRMAVCVYHLKDDPQVIPATVRAIVPRYRSECGPCLVSEGRLSQEVLFFF